MADYVWGNAGAYTFGANSILSGCRIVNAGASDDVQIEGNWHAHDGSAVFHNHQVEGAGNALDTVGTAHIAPVAWAGAGNGLLGSDAVKNGWSAVSAIPQLQANTSWTIEWWQWLASTPNQAGTYLILYDADLRPSIYSYRSGAATEFFNRIRGVTGEVSIGGTITGAGWRHMCIERSVDSLYIYVNGTKLDGPTACAAVVGTSTMIGWAADNMCSGGSYQNDLYGTQSALHGGSNFSPRAYESGTAILEHALAAQKLNSVAWTLTGSGGATVKAVEVNTGTNGSPVWTAVGGVNPTSPISGLDYAVPTQCVRLTLAPSTDALQLYTPTLSDVTLGLVSAVTGSARIVVPTGPVVLGRNLFAGGLA